MCLKPTFTPHWTGLKVQTLIWLISKWNLFEFVHIRVVVNMVCTLSRVVNVCVCVCFLVWIEFPSTDLYGSQVVIYICICIVYQQVCVPNADKWFWNSIHLPEISSPMRCEENKYTSSTVFDYWMPECVTFPVNCKPPYIVSRNPQIKLLSWLINTTLAECAIDKWVVREWVFVHNPWRSAEK